MQSDSVSKIYRNGTILTVDRHDSQAEAVAVTGDRITAAGTDTQIAALAGSDTQLIDLRGRTLIPGFVDAHSHVAFVGEQRSLSVSLNPPRVGTVRTIDELVAAVRARAEETPPGEWVVGNGYDDTLLAERRHPTANDLDRASTEHPILVVHVTGHLAAVNHRALELAGVTRATPQPDGGLIRRDARGEPDGVLEEGSAMAPFYRLIPPNPEPQRLAAIEDAARLYAQKGITTAQNGATEVRQLRDFATLAGAGAGSLPIRVVVWPSYTAWERTLSRPISLDGVDPERLRLGAVKLFADGSIQGYTGHLCDPYHVPREGDPGYRGYGTLSADVLRDQVGAVYRAGLQVAVHANGDAAIDAVLDAIDAAQRATGREDARPVMVHAQMTRDDQLDRMARLGVVPSFFSLHTYYWGDRHRDIFIGPERARRISPARSAAERGLRFTIHTDAPVVPMDPLLLMWSAVNRQTSSGLSLGPEQCISVRRALRATTIDAAWQSFEETTRGSIEPGKLADFTILSENPLAVPEAIRDTEVCETIVGGETVYRLS